MRNKNICPVCGYVDLDFSPYDNHGSPSFEICPCCGVEFGYDDFSISHESLREKWVCNGFKWFSKHNKPPQGWNPIKQLEEASLKVKSFCFIYKDYSQ